ncbi:DUF3613 domain-containing protein [Burkholderia stagnalis]
MTDLNLDRPVRCRRAIALLALLGAAAAAHGQTSTRTASEIGPATDAWLALQRDNRAAGPDVPMLGDAASLTYQRYLDSFKNKIPVSMDSPLKSVGNDASSGQGSSQ